MVVRNSQDFVILRASRGNCNLAPICRVE